MSDKKVRIGVVGCGAMGRNHINMLKVLPDVEIAALIDPRQEVAEERLEQLCKPASQSPQIFKELEKAIDSLEMDGVVIVTPHVYHLQQTMLSLEKGLHVLCEKPVATTEEDMLKIMEKSRETGKYVQAAYAGVISDEQAYAKRMKEWGMLGDVTFVQGKVAQMWWPHAQAGWRGDPAISGGGQVFDSGSHLLVSILWLTDFEVAQVFAWVDYKHDMKVDIDAAIAIDFVGDALGSVMVSGDAGGFDHNATLYGTKGRVSVGLYGMYMDHYEGNNLVKSMKADKPGDVCKRFVEVIRGEQEPLSLEYSLRLVGLQNAILESGRTGVPVRLSGS